MLEGMNIRRFVPDTQREYIRAVKRLAAFLGRGITVTLQITSMFERKSCIIKGSVT
jgi:hypothetical protein